MRTQTIMESINVVIDHTDDFSELSPEEEIQDLQKRNEEIEVNSAPTDTSVQTVDKAETTDPRAPKPEAVPTSEAGS